MALDLGAIFSGVAQVAGSYYGARAQQQNVAYSGGLGNMVGIPDYGPTAGQQPVLDIPFVDVVGTTGKKGYVYDPNANCGNGKWLRKRRRRHRNLATRGDIKDLSALKGVLGAGKLLEVWIATHG